MSRLTNILISASAGTGKTYQLSQRYLALLALHQGKNPERLIACTFTRKAAGEFKDRILTDLANGAISDTGATQLADNLWKQIKGTSTEPGLWPEATDEWKEKFLTRALFIQMLRMLTQNLARLNLCTIDSLFAQIASTNTFELGAGGFNMITNTEEELAKKEALLALYKEYSTDSKKVREFESLFFEGMNSDSESVAIEKTMLQRLKFYHDLFLDIPLERQWGSPAALGFTEEELIPPLSPEQFDETLVQLRQEAEELIEPDKKLPKKLEMYIRFLDAFSPYTKTGKLHLHQTDKDKEMANFRKSLEVYWSDALDDIILTWTTLELKKAMFRTQATYRMLAVFEKKYADLIRNRGKFKFTDVTRLLATEGISPELKRDMEYRMYCRYDHWMLDEFQDTSKDQWKVIQPFLKDLVESKTDGDGSIFVVGDLKQSIYQWRGGDPQLFGSVAEQLNLRERSMAISYRSSQPVLNLVNAVCDYRETVPTAEKAAITLWGRYPDHFCAPQLKERSGVAQIWKTPYEKGKSYPKHKIEAVCTAIADLLNQIKPLERSLSTVILVNTGKEATDMRSWLTSKGIPAEVCSDVNVGSDSPIGKELLHFFKWLLTPGDPTNVCLLENSPLCSLIRQKDSLKQSWHYWHLMLEKKGYSAVLTEIDHRLNESGPELTPFQQNRLAVWLNEAVRIDERGLSLSEWIIHMEGLTRREDPAGDVVGIMTIHKSKGLGFDIVILPQLGNDEAFADRSNLKQLIKKDVDGTPEGVILLPNKKVYLEVPKLLTLTRQWDAQQQFDGFCKLYVALTRAKRATYVVLPATAEDNPETKTKKTSPDANPPAMGRIIRKVAGNFAHGEPLPVSGAMCLYTDGQPDWYKDITPKESRTTPTPAPAWPTLKPLYRERVSPSGIHRLTEPPADTSHTAQTEAGRAAAEFGTQVHAVFERLTRWDDADKPVWAQSPATDAEKTVAECLQCPDIKALFMPPTGTVIMKEQRIEAIEGDKWISGIIDRLQLNGDHATIIDFKTDRTDSPDELRARHADQLNAYAAIVARITGIKPQNIACVLVSTHMKRVVEL